MKTTSKGDIFSVTIEIDDELLEKMRKAPELTQNALQSAADYWHSKVLPKHFFPDAEGRYKFARRSDKYLKERRKFGKPDLVLSGSMRNDLTSKAAFINGAAKSVTLKMWARVLNLVPTMPENSDEEHIHHFGRYKKNGYPNLKREIKVLTDDEHAAIAAVAKRSLEITFGDTEGRESDD